MNKSANRKSLKIGILGFGREGKSVLKYLKRSSQFKNSKIEILDKKISVNYLNNLGRFDMIFRSPGVPYNLPELKKAREDGVYFSSVTRLFFENYKGKIIGITGTKGKGTTSTLLYEMLKAEGKRVFLAGNIGKSALDFLVKYGDYPLAVLELSSFQLQDLDISPTIAVILDIFPDHQDAHANLREYYEAKENIGKFQSAPPAGGRRKDDKIFFFADNAMSKKLAMKSPAKKFPVDYKKFKSFGWNDLKIKGIHNFRNAVMAATVATSLGVKWTTAGAVAKKFKGLEHRLEFVRRIGLVNFYNDSSSTNPMTTAAAIEAFGREAKVLIIGGRDKVWDYSPIKNALRKHRETTVILMGENKNKIEKSIRVSGIKIKKTKDLVAAVKEAYKIATVHKSTANVVFSPGAASFDMFKDYADRGNKFKKIVKSL
ncbi:MAG: UDP-N-acetylmuramoyl-L-alanine--D-glutamate ligase [Patescibacteria group bacterium]